MTYWLYITRSVHGLETFESVEKCRDNWFQGERVMVHGLLDLVLLLSAQWTNIAARWYMASSKWHINP